MKFFKLGTAAALLVATAALFFSNSLGARLSFSSGIKDSTNYIIMKEIIAACGGETNLENVENPGGSPGAVMDVASNTTNGGIVRFDVLWMRAYTNSESVSNIKSLMPLHKEQVVFVVLNKNVQFSQGFTNMKELQGLTVGAWAGGIFTAQAIRKLAGLDYNITEEYRSTPAVLQAIKEGKISAGVFAGVTPMAGLDKLDGSVFRLLSMDTVTISKLKEVYTPTQVSYPNLSPKPINTVEVPSVLVVNQPKTKALAKSFADLRECVRSKLSVLRETPGNAPAWGSVTLDKDSEHPKWDVYKEQR